MASEAAEDFKSSLGDLTFNSKPLISMLTMVAEENLKYAENIVQVIEEHIQKVTLLITYGSEYLHHQFFLQI